MKHDRQLCATGILVLTLALAGLLGVTPTPAGAATIVVNTVVDESDGNCYDGDCSLRDAVDTAAPGDTVVFAASLSGQTITLTIGQLDIDRNLTIDGSALASPVRISGNNTFRVFATHGNVVATLRRLVIADGQTSDGVGGAGIFNEAVLTVTGCTVTSNTTADNGGGIRNVGTLTVNGGSVISYNQGDYGGGIRNEGTLTVRDSTISDNTANFGGGMDNYVGSLEMTNSTVERNTAVHAGGGMTTGAAAHIEDTAFRDNSAQAGGGIDSHEPGGTLTLVRCTFEGNTADGDGGGLINYDATVEITGFGPVSRSASGGGPTQDLGRAGATTLPCRLEGNFAGNSGGGIAMNGGTLTVAGCAFIGNTAAHYGGGINKGDGALVVTNSEFSGNTAQVNNGGAIMNGAGDLTIAASTFTDNSAFAGGALYHDNGEAVVSGSAFTANGASSDGGAIQQFENGTLTVEDCTFDGNTASGPDRGWGGAIRNWGALTLNRSTFTDNTAHWNGGAVENSGGDLTVTACTFVGNSAHTGGALNNNTGGTLTMTDSTLRENTAGVGGGLYNDNSSTAEVSGSTFVANSATDTTGGGIANAGGSSLTVGNSTLSANTAASYGGGIHNQDGVLTLTNVTLAGNSSGGGGGISNAPDGTLNYRNTLVAGSPLGGDCLSSGTIGENIHNLVQDGSCSPLLTGDPRLGPMADNGGPTETHALQPDSPAIDMGDPATCLANDQRSEARDDWACDIGAFELKHPDSDTVVKAIGGPGVYTFGPTKVKVQVVTQGGLTGLTIRKVVGNHAGRTGSGGSGGGVGWGEWFVLTPNSGANGTFQAALTLPALFTPNANDKVCRYLGGALWDCAGHGFGLAPFPHITRQGVSAFSDWAAGDEVGPNAVTVREFRAAPWTCVQQLRGLWRR